MIYIENLHELVRLCFAKLVRGSTWKSGRTLNRYQRPNSPATSNAKDFFCAMSSDVTSAVTTSEGIMLLGGARPSLAVILIIARREVQNGIAWAAHVELPRETTARRREWLGFTRTDTNAIMQIITQIREDEDLCDAGDTLI